MWHEEVKTHVQGEEHQGIWVSRESILLGLGRVLKDVSSHQPGKKFYLNFVLNSQEM